MGQAAKCTLLLEVSAAAVVGAVSAVPADGASSACTAGNSSTVGNAETESSNVGPLQSVLDTE